MLLMLEYQHMDKKMILKIKLIQSLLHIKIDLSILVMIGLKDYVKYTI